ncbi:efflux RND transporter periplasmic adaptor subunit [Mangrovimonas sp. AS39]|uniref:efflux RND transporter periplasmic adaptor subunit n=1 Tax=Mangrovimonas futianensis TaxID=2895523 RepID=UPI001E2AFD91|nr:efflux RND transporter periplasmic adaptor subunit [Mangrovimonas futianensis]MCF1190037.1 efflux RND transporter periplasmic adaptor subunit [Mangrovimonas futianensis]MCF1194212.1 efflux RND transporter periplasmic adaptor subunit [Mangrovimonas futianensis]
MKKIYILLATVLILTSCGGEKKKNSVENVLESKNIELLRNKRTEIVAKQQEIADQLKLIDAEISKLDTVKHAPLITTIKVNTEEFVHYLEIQGNVTTKNLITIYPEYNGILTQVFVKEGQKVNKGQILAKIDDGGLSQQLAQLKIQEDLAKTTFDRQKRLWEQNIGSEMQYLQAKSNYETQAEAVNQLKQQIGKTTVTAPFSGTIDDVITEQGNVVSVGMSPLFRLVNLSDMYIETDVPESYLTDIKKGKSVIVDFPILGKQIDTEIRQVGDFINPANRTFKVEVAIPNDDKSIKPNLTAKLKINDYTSEKALLIPQSIISENAQGEQFIYTVKDKQGENEGKAKKTIIKTGRNQGDIVEVLEGITDGEEIIMEGARSVKDGQPVKIIEVK